MAWDAVDGPTVVKAPTSEKGHTHKNHRMSPNVNVNADTSVKMLHP